MRRSWKMKDAIKMMENNMSPEAVRRAHIKAEQDIMTIRLAQLREEKNVKQSEMANFTQSSVSKIEKRKDIKISKLKNVLEDEEFIYLPPTEFDAEAIKTLPDIHKDPFDRLLIAQAIENNLTIVTTDSKIPQYNVKTIW